MAIFAKDTNNRIAEPSLQFVYDSDLLAWVRMKQPVIEATVSVANIAKETGGNLATIVTNQTNGSQKVALIGNYGDPVSPTNPLDVGLPTNSNENPLSVQITRLGVAQYYAIESSNSATSIVDQEGMNFGASIFNDTSYPAYIRFGDVDASLTDYSLILQPQAYWESPFWFFGKITFIQSVTDSGKYLRLTLYRRG